MKASDQGNQLSVSSKKAMHWAAVMVALRSEHSKESTQQGVNVFDLFVGVLLSHPSDSEAKILLEHFGLLPGQVLPDDYPLPDEKNVQRLIAWLPAKELPDLDSTVSEVIKVAMRHGLSSGSHEFVELQALYAALLEVSSPLSLQIDKLISTRGASLSEIVRLNKIYLDGKESNKNYAELLKEHHPYNPEPVRIPTYMTDHGQEMDLSHDLVDIRAEVDAFAYLLASRGLKPPLAVGLFGDWGSGKSFFMDSVRNRIEQLVTHNDIKNINQTEVPFWKRIIQIEFNAWHYVDGELWASLVDHIFNQLRLAGDNDDLVDKRKKYWIETLEKTHTQLKALERKKQGAEDSLKTKKQEVEKIEREKKENILELEKLKQDAVKDIVLEESVKEVNDALKPLLLSVGLPSPDEIAKQLSEARVELGRGRVLFHYMQGDDNKKKIRNIAIVIVAIPVIIGGLSLLNVPAVISAFGGIAAYLATGLSILGKVTKWARDRFDVIYNAEQKVEEEIESKKAQWKKKIAAEEAKVDEARNQLIVLLNEESKLSDEILGYEKQLETVSTAKVLNDFVVERAGSSDYKTRLGVPALIQQDFKNLSNLILRHNKECEGFDKGINKEDKEHYFNRIILYIDDLDRCPDERVVDVLQAVHLLLAFELFVVVVAVDSRWLNHALTKHYPALTKFNGDKNKATSEDYLEKIFQIPFWVRPLGDDARKNIITGLLRGNLEHTASQQHEDTQSYDLSLGDEEKKVLAGLDPRISPPALDASTLTISKDELDFLNILSPLMGETPRTVKRFVNLYQLVRIVYRSSTLARKSSDIVADNNRLAFILAIADGLPHLAPDLFTALMKTTNKNKLENVLKSIQADNYLEEHKSLSEWLSKQEKFKNTCAIDFLDIIKIVERFLFRTGVNS